ncbi:MAG: signal peptidase I, partial [Oscillospiraceae bacterium]|nr:signal peptidase I [Oscillospiraceae bacterium]
ATGGQTVDIDFETGTLYVDGKIQVESYIFEPTYLNEGLSFPLTVPENSLFVMGDNRNHSLDSRSVSIGCVGTDRVLGKALFILIPGRQTNETGAVTGKRDFSRIGAAS